MPIPAPPHWSRSAAVASLGPHVAAALQRSSSSQLPVPSCAVSREAPTRAPETAHPLFATVEIEKTLLRGASFAMPPSSCRGLLVASPLSIGPCHTKVEPRTGRKDPRLHGP
ncbi:hypothetical protein OPT61_g139 [Boeremia exigua]|uniref:Uncharacterized protein n=1 Tax=Boeremia exigua TaxID=749465 RepID=A0ACC2IUU9_9PLEO|nr:hypothetical protein OPT61_g139 [Boeremia exigua]